LLKRFDVFKLKDAGIRQQFILQISNHFAALEDIDEATHTEEGSNNHVERNWKDIVHTYTETSSAILGQKKKKHKDWLSEDTWTAIEERKQLKA